MTGMIPYLVFPGTCKTAMEFYAQVLNGQITSIQTFGDSPVPVPEQHRERIFDSELMAGKIRFKASDNLPDQAMIIGNNISLFVSFADTSFRKQVFDKLAEGGKVMFPLDENFGMLRDKFGIQWMLVSEH